MRHVVAALLFLPVATAGVAAEQRGIVGIAVSDKGVITSVSHRSPAAAAGIMRGDRLLAIAGHRIQTPITREQWKRISGGSIGEAVRVKVRRARDGAVRTLKLRRVDPQTLKPKDIPPESDMRFLASGSRRPNQAMQRTASKAAIDVLRVCHPRSGYVTRCSGLAVADLVSR